MGTTLNIIEKESSWGTEATKINQNFTNVSLELTKLGMLGKASFGPYKSSSNLPSGASENATAWVSATLTPPFQVWQVQSGKWVNTGFTYTQDIGTGDLATKDDLSEQDAKLAELSSGQGVYNLDANIPLPSGQFYTSTTARAAVPSAVRKLGLIITYKTDTATNVTEQFTGSVISSWTTDTNWTNVGATGGNKILNWTDDLATTRKLVSIKERKPGLMISYNHPDKGWVNEQYIGTNTLDVYWVNDANWAGDVYYFESSTYEGSANKTTNITPFRLIIGERILIKMIKSNTANDVTLDISGSGAKPLYIEGLRASSSNSWDAGDLLEVYFDGTNYQSTIYNKFDYSLEWNSDYSTTRLQVPRYKRKARLIINYVHPTTGVINEQYIGTDFTDTEWAKSSNWETIPTAKMIDDAIKPIIPASIDKDEIFELGYKDSYWVEDGLINATEFSIYDDRYIGEIEDLSGNNNPIQVTNLDKIDYDQSIAGIRGGELILNPYNSIGNFIDFDFSTPLSLTKNVLTFEIYCNIHADYFWNKKEIKAPRNPTNIFSSMIFSDNLYFRFFMNGTMLGYAGGLNMDKGAVEHDNSFIDGLSDTIINNRYIHLVLIRDYVNKKFLCYIDGNLTFELTLTRNDSLANRVFSLTGYSFNIKCFRVYNKALSVSEIEENYNNTINKFKV